MSKKAIIITSIITVSVGSIAFYFLYWRKRGGVSESDKAMLEQATAVQLNTTPLPPVSQDIITTGSSDSYNRDEYGDRLLKSSTVQGPIKTY